MTKQVARTLAEIHEDEVLLRIRDRSQDVSKDVLWLLAQWELDLYSRKPGPALTDDGRLQVTDLDLATFLFALVQRSAVINLPRYTGRRPKQQRAGEHVVSASNRHGKVTGLSANDGVFSFSVRVQDADVVTTDGVGAPRNFMVVDLDGKFYDGWDRIEFLPTARENDFLNRHELWTGNVVYFKNFVAPQRWVSFFGRYYFLTKALIERLQDRAHFLHEELKRLKSKIDADPRLAQRAGARLEDEPGPESKVVGKSKTVDVDAFQAAVRFGGLTGVYEALSETDPAAWARALEERRALTYGIVPRLRFAARSVELAFWNQHKDVCFPEAARFPAWVQGASWDTDYVEEGKRTKWFRLVLGQSAVGALGTSILWRVWKKRETVAA